MLSHELTSLLFNKSEGCSTSSAHDYPNSGENIPASLLIPSLPATTHEEAHIVQTKRSFPSFVQPHRAAAAESMASGFDVYVEGLNVDNLSKKA